MQTLFNRFICQYCGSNRIVVKDVSGVLFRPNESNLYMGEADSHQHFPVYPYIMCESCQKKQDKEWMVLWGNKFGMLDARLEDV